MDIECGGQWRRRNGLLELVAIGWSWSAYWLNRADVRKAGAPE